MQTYFNSLLFYKLNKGKMMSGFIAWLQGKKSYIVMVLGFIFNLGVLAGIWPIDSQLWALINTILGFLGLGALKSASKKLDSNT